MVIFTYNLITNKMREDFRPTMTQMNYFDVDLSAKMKEAGIIRDDEETMVRNIEWYNWDNDPRWFVHVMLFNERGERRGYVEVDAWVVDWNGGDNPMGIEEVKLAGHGYPCISTTVVQFNKETDDWIIIEDEE
jgi:hypothetical protein